MSPCGSHDPGIEDEALSRESVAWNSQKLIQPGQDSGVGSGLAWSPPGEPVSAVRVEEPEGPRGSMA